MIYVFLCYMLEELVKNIKHSILPDQNPGSSFWDILVASGIIWSKELGFNQLFNVSCAKRFTWRYTDKNSTRIGQSCKKIAWIWQWIIRSKTENEYQIWTIWVEIICVGLSVYFNRFYKAIDLLPAP